jgi:PAS domain S-box-containing protein
LIFYQQLNFIQEYIGQLRATVGCVLANNEISKERIILIRKLDGLVQNYIRTLNSYSNIEQINLWQPIENKKCVKETNDIISAILEKPLSNISVNALEWFKISTCVVDAIDKNTNNFLNKIELDAKITHNDMKTKLLIHSLFWIGAITVTLITLFILFIINKKMLIEHRLLENYKKAIDNSTIVSKTDKYGKITYVNKAFCDISGYSPDELIGKTHSILKHPDFDQSIFKDLWKTLQGGKTWSGQIENLAKNGDSYWVNAAISPIYDNDENLVEYVAIRQNITDLIKLNAEIQNTQHELIYRMGESVESRSKESGNHIRKVAMYSKLLGQLYGLENQICEDLFIASTMHDMGKIAIPDSILLKPGKLNDKEWKIMQTHSNIGHKILSGSNLPILQMASDIANEHHERYNGKGYPRAIKGKDISIYARIVSIVDVFDALISDRIYKKAWEYERVIKLFENDIGKQFDSHLVKLFLDNIEQFMKIKQEFED